MKKLLCIALIFFALAPVAFAQQDTTAMPKWEVGLDLLWLVDKNTMPKNSMFLRYNFMNKQGRGNALRLRFGLDAVPMSDSVMLTDPRKSKETLWAPYLQMGFEWQQRINSKASYFYGADAVFYYSKNRFEKIFNYQKALYKGFDNHYSFGSMGIIGIKYRPTDWMALSIESSLNIIYHMGRNEYSVSAPNPNFPNGVGNLSSTKTTNLLRIDFKPITVFNLSFYPKKFKR